MSLTLTSSRPASNGRPASETPFDPAFKEIIRNKAGLYVWRIVHFSLEKVPQELHGSFYSGDCYLVLAMISATKNVDARIHYWLGDQSTQDEQGAVAVKAIELDDLLGGSPVQYREVQGSESPVFLKYFSPKGIRHLDGGAASGFHHTVTEHRDALYQVKGTKTCRVAEVPITWDSFNDGDAFVLDLGAAVYVWKGKNCRHSEACTAAEYARRLRDDRGGNDKCVVVMTDDGAESRDLTNGLAEIWNKHLPLSKRRVKSAAEAGSDEKVPRELAAQLKLFKIKDEHGTVRIEEEKPGPLFKTDLKSDDAYLIDNGPTQIAVWVGRGASENERKFAVRNAEMFAKKKGYPPTIPVTRVVEGAETASFKALFVKWPEPGYVSQPYQFNKIAKPTQISTFDAAKLHEDRKLAAESQMFDDGSGQVNIYRVERSNGEQGAKSNYLLIEQKKSLQDTHDVGMLYGGDCYIILYQYKVRNADKVVIYYWIGRHSSTDEQAACAALVVEMDNTRFKGTAVQVRVVQGKEPRHFMAIFHGLLITFDGGKAGWTKGDRDQVVGEFFLLRIHCQSDLDRKAVQVPLSAESLNSSDAFVLFGKGGLFIWCGKGCTGDERQVARKIAESRASGRDPIIVMEGQEKPEFWAELGGKKEYASSKKLQEPTAPFTARLFQCSNKTGRFTAEEIHNYTQDDLAIDDVMLLDVDEAIYIWLGKDSNEQERQLSLKMAVDYLSSDPRGRDPNLPVFVIKQGAEPPSFTGFFAAWDPTYWAKIKTYDQMKAELKANTSNLQLSAQKIMDMQNRLGQEPNYADAEKFPYDKLIGSPDELPPGVNPNYRERHLNPEDFARIMKMPYEEFVTKPKWRQTELKKAAKLF